MDSNQTDEFRAFKASITRIYHSNGAVIGAGFLVSNQYVLTCAHVITQALSLPLNTKEMPIDLIDLDFPLIEAKKKLQAQVSFWQPVSSTELVEDIAVLKLNSNLLDNVQAARLVQPEDWWKHPIRIFGFPKGHDNGIWASGELRDENGKHWLQMEDIKVPGLKVEPGFSGAPVWDEQSAGVVGMIVAAEKRREDVKVAFIIPTQSLVKAWPELNQWIKKPIKTPPPWIIRRLKDQELTSSVLVDRSKEIQKIVSYLLEEQSQNIVVLQGAAGFGKSVLALLTCCESKIIQHFTGGIFWVDLGEGKNILEGMRKLYKQLTNLDCPSHLDKNDIAIELMKQWKELPHLIVLNHVEKKEDFSKFYSSSNNKHCSWLVTTHILDLVNINISKSIHIESLRPDESTLLIEYELSQQGEFNKEKLRELVAQLYEWPLLLNLVRDKINSLIENHTPNEVLDNIIKRLKRQGWIKYFGNEISENIRISFDSLKEDEKELFEELVIFPENLSIPLSILEKFWGLDDIDVEDLCQKLYNLSLLKKFETDEMSAINYIRLNSYLRQYLRQKNEIKEKLPGIHKKLLQSYENKYNIKLKEQLPEDFFNLLSNNKEKTYFKRFYKYHRRRAKLIQEN